MSLEEERDNLKRENRAVQEMLAQVLNAIGAVNEGQPVLVSKADMGNLPDGTQIRIDDDGDDFIFYLEKP